MMQTESSRAAQSLLRPLDAAIDEARALSKTPPATGWIQQQTCEKLAATYMEARNKLHSIFTDAFLSLSLCCSQSSHLQADTIQHAPHYTQFLSLVKPSLDTLLSAVIEGCRFLNICRPSPEQDDSMWLRKALIYGLTTDAVNFHLHDLFIAFSAVSSAIEDAVSKLAAQPAGNAAARQSTNHGIPVRRTLSLLCDPKMAQIGGDPNRFWAYQRKSPFVLGVHGVALDYLRLRDEETLNIKLQHMLQHTQSDKQTSDASSGHRSKVEGPLDPKLLRRFSDTLLCRQEEFDERIDPKCHWDMDDLDKGDIIFQSGQPDHPVQIRKVRVALLKQEFAFKEFKKAWEGLFEEEVRIHARLHHPNIANAVALFQGPRKCGILMELMHENLNSFMYRNRPGALSLQQKVSIMLQIAKGMEYMHDRGIIHRDLKPHNVLVRTLSERTIQIKLSDFGTAKSKSSDSSSYTTKKVGTSVYRAPEVLNDDMDSPKYTKSADVYSFAITCYELLAEREAFDQHPIKAGRLWKNVCAGERPDLESVSEDACPPYLKHCLATWWDANPECRQSFAQICGLLRHLYACLCRVSTSTTVTLIQNQFPFISWPYARWNKAQQIAQHSLKRLAARRTDDDWKAQGNVCEFSRVNEIPYEMHAINVAIKKAQSIRGELDEHAADEEAGAISWLDGDGVTSLDASRRDPGDDVFSSPCPSEAVAAREHETVPLTAAAEADTSSSNKKSWSKSLKQCCCFSPEVGPSTHEAFHDYVRRRN